MKKAFLNNEIWILTFGGAFQRANIYKQNFSEEIRNNFRSALREEVEKIVTENYHSKVLEIEHIKNIKSLVYFSKNLKVNNVTIPINFGVSQKLINLYLKYLWCLREIPEPPHFPVDRIIQTDIIKIVKEHNLETLALLPWTKFEDDVHYRKIMKTAELIIKEVELYKNVSLAEFELLLFNRKNTN